MSTGQVLILGAIAGFTIFLGLPLGRVRGLDSRIKTLLSSFATGILLFLLWDVLTHAVDPIEASIERDRWGHFAAITAVFTVGISVGLLSLVYYEQWIVCRQPAPLFGAGDSPPDVKARTPHAGLPPAHLALLIAIGIGLHNFSEGLAIGQSAAADELSLAYALIIGFALHNSTEGFGIVGPLGGDVLPSWRFLFLLGLIGGGPTFVGTALGQVWVDEFVSVAFLALAAGSILFVINELLHMNYASRLKRVVSWGLLLGLLAGFGTDWVLIAAGA